MLSPLLELFFFVLDVCRLRLEAANAFSVSSDTCDRDEDLTHRLKLRSTSRLLPASAQMAKYCVHVSLESAVR